MKKTDKKIENSIIKALKVVCGVALDEIEGFKWITHLARYGDFPDSLCIVCIFDTNSALADACAAQTDDYLRVLIKDQLEAVGVHVSDIAQHVYFDTEAGCKEQSWGKWHERVR